MRHGVGGNERDAGCDEQDVLRCSMLIRRCAGCSAMRAMRAAVNAMFCSVDDEFVSVFGVR